MFKQKFYVYVCFSLKDRKKYIGSTDNIKERLKQHYAGKVKSTRYRLPLKLIYYEVYNNEKDARLREKYLKGGGRARHNLNLQLKKTLEEFKE